MGLQLVQPSMSGGEMSPATAARVDLNRYGISLRKCRNFIVRPSGGIVNRPGLQYLGAAKAHTTQCLLLPFVVGEEAAYVIELGHLYLRFWFQGVRLESGGSPVELVAPWTQDEIADVKFTQSADVMTLVHPSHPPRQLRRLTPTSFQLVVFETRDGPFQPLNANTSTKMAASGAEGNVTVTANADVFTADFVGSLVLLEEEELRATVPWAPDERNVTVGELRRSDGKTYRASAVTPTPAAAGSYIITGNVRPTHDFGRAWDGPGDTRTDGVNDYGVGVEWEYVHSGFGIVRLTGYVSPTQMTGVVNRRLPDSVVGGVGTPATTWDFTGDGATTDFAITGAASASTSRYIVKIGGVPVQSNPYQPPPGGGGGGGGGSTPPWDPTNPPIYLP